MKFEDIKQRNEIFLYAGDLPQNRIKKTNKNWIGLSLFNCDNFHIKHDVTRELLLSDCSVDIYQSEDVFEHIELHELRNVINDIFRVLKKGGVFRLSLPDYNCDILRNRSLKNEKGEIIFDKFGGGDFDYSKQKVINGGHLWFPTYEKVKELIESTNFVKENVKFYHFYKDENSFTMNDIDYSFGFISRTPDHDERVKNPRRPMSIVLDCKK
jgi:hypothetical protein